MNEPLKKNGDATQAKDSSRRGGVEPKAVIASVLTSTVVAAVVSGFWNWKVEISKEENERKAAAEADARKFSYDIIKEIWNTGDPNERTSYVDFAITMQNILQKDVIDFLMDRKREANLAHRPFPGKSTLTAISLTPIAANSPPLASASPSESASPTPKPSESPVAYNSRNVRVVIETKRGKAGKTEALKPIVNALFDDGFSSDFKPEQFSSLYGKQGNQPVLFFGSDLTEADVQKVVEIVKDKSGKNWVINPAPAPGDVVPPGTIYLYLPY